MERLNCHTFGVHVKATDVVRSRRFYEEVLGLVPVFGFGDDGFRASLPAGCDSTSEPFRGVIYKVAGTEFELMEAHPAVKPEVFAETVPSSKVSVMLRVDSLVPLLRDKVDLVAPVRHFYWGSVEAVLRDPDGFIVVVIATDTPEEMAAVRDLVEVEEMPAPA